MWHFHRKFKSFQTFNSSKCDSMGEMNLQQNVESLDVRIHHRIWDGQKHLLQNIWKTEEKDFWELNETSIQSKCDSIREFNVKQNIKSLDVGIHHRILDVEIHLLQNIW